VAEQTAGQRWAWLSVLRRPPVLAMALASLATGFAQFAAIAALGDVAAAFGAEDRADGTLAGAAGLSFTTLGAGLAVVRLASLVGLPLASAADRLGRRRTLLAFLTAGLALTAAAATSQGFWWFVAAFALARPGLSAVNAIAGVVAAEESSTGQRSAAMALVTVGYGVGSGTVTLLRAGLGDLLGFRGLFVLALVPLVVLLPLLARVMREPPRFLDSLSPGTATPPPTTPPPTTAPPATVAAASFAGRQLSAPWRAGLRRRTAVLATTTLTIALASSPATGLLFVYGEGVLGVEPIVVAVAVAGAAPLGAIGLLLGRWAADRFGRRIAAATAQVLIAAAVVTTYAGTVPALIGGYLVVLLAQSAYAPPTGALAAELFPTRVRATAAGWLTAAGVLGAVGGLVLFGVAADAAGHAGAGALAVAVPAILAAGAFALVPETRGGELSDRDREGVADEV